MLTALGRTAANGGIKSASAYEFESDPVCDKKKVTVDIGKNRGQTGVVVGEPKPALGTELGFDTDAFKVLLDGRKQKSTFTRKQLTFLDDSQQETIAAAPSAPASAKGRKRATPGRGDKGKGGSKGRGKRPRAENAPPGLTYHEETAIPAPCEEQTGSAGISKGDGGFGNSSSLAHASLAHSPGSVAVAERTPSSDSGPARAQKRRRAHKSLPPDSYAESMEKPDMKKPTVEEESVESSESDERVVKTQPPPQVLRTRRLKPCQFALFPTPMDMGCVPVAVA